MNDQSVLEDLGEALAPPTPAAPADLRRRVLTAALRSDRPRPGWLRPGLVGAGLFATAAAVTAVAAVVFAGAPAGNAPVNGPPDRSDEAVAIDAVHVLRLAAQHAATGPATTPRGDQYLFVEDVWVVGGERQPGRHWISIDGTHDGLSEGIPTDAAGPGCRDGRMAVDGDPQRTIACTPRPAYDPTLPTTAAAMLDWLARPEGTEPGAPPADEMFLRLVRLLSTPVAPAVEAVAFEAATDIPSITVVPSAKDVSGRSGIGVVVTGDHARVELVFDAGTYAYLGHNIVQNGNLVRGRAILRTAIVDEVRQLP